MRIISNKDNYISTIFTLPGVPVTYWLVDTFIKEASKPLFKNLNILNIYDVFKVETLKFVYDSLHRLNPPQFHHYFRYPSNVQNTAANRNNNLDTPYIRTETYGFKSLKYTGTVLWNTLPHSVRYKPSRKSFAKYTKLHYIDLIN